MSNTVYLLEDDESICELVKCPLDMHSISCETFTTIRAFNAALDAALPDVVLLDIMLADGNGLDVLARIKARYPALFVIIPECPVGVRKRCVDLLSGKLRLLVVCHDCNPYFI